MAGARRVRSQANSTVAKPSGNGLCDRLTSPFASELHSCKTIRGYSNGPCGRARGMTDRGRLYQLSRRDDLAITIKYLTPHGPGACVGYSFVMTDGRQRLK